MKTKHFDKRLVLKKKTIANLDNAEMRVLYGGTLHITCNQQKTTPPYVALTDDDYTCIAVTCPSQTLTDNDNTCPITACYTGVWC